MILDATDLIVGRFATVVAKKALLGENVDVINCENAIITGTKKEILDKIKNKVSRGIPMQGPYFPRKADRMVRRVIRGMLPYKKAKGEEAFHRVMCYIGVPANLKDKPSVSIDTANVKKLPNMKYITVGEISKELGAKL